VETERSSQARAAGEMRLRSQLFLGSALLTSAILLIAAWVINHQVVGQARRQVQAEVETLLPLYDVIWSEYAQRLGALGVTMANAPSVKTIFGDPRASRDRATLHEMIADFGEGGATAVDLFVITDGAGQVTLAEMQGAPLALTDLSAARLVAESQEQHRGFAILGGRLFQLVLTPVLLHSGSVDYQNTLAVLGTGAELDRELAAELKGRMRSDVIFLAGDRLYASSLPAADETRAAAEIVRRGLAEADPARPAEISLGSEEHLAFARDLLSSDSQRIGQVVVLRSLADASQLFQAISNRLLLLWTLSIAAALLISYLIAGRITRPVESLAAGVREFGRGNYDYAVETSARGEIGQLARAFDQMRRSLRQTQAALLKSERLATVGQMASSIIHDLRNPLAAISTAAEVMSRDGLPLDRRHALLESQLRASQRMNDMLNELLEYSRGSYQLELTRQPLAAIVERAVRGLSPVVASEQIVLETDIPAEIEVVVDAERLRRVFENLLLNAIQATPTAGRVRIGARFAGARRVRIDVLDSGPGVPKAVRERLFEPFVSHGKEGGTGLGLAIAHGIVSAHGGLLGLEDAADGGADFYIELPLA
jgi:signal transduction histidine kinase